MLAKYLFHASIIGMIYDVSSRIYFFEKVHYAFLILILASYIAIPCCANTLKDEDLYFDQAVSMPDKEVQRFANAIASIKHYYINTVKDETLFAHAIDGMLKGLDPHSTYLNKNALKNLKETTDGKFAGIGIRVITEQDFLKVISPIDGSPASLAGVKPGDLIIKIDNTFLQHTQSTEAINMIRGKPGSQVTLTILRKDSATPLNLTITRKMIDIDRVQGRLLSNGFAYTRISLFHSPTAKELVHLLTQLRRKNQGKQLSGVILDLRNNPGGLLEASIAVSDLFLDRKYIQKHFPSYHNIIVYAKGRIPMTNIMAEATYGDKLSNVPMVVLINNGSASASEIVAGALKDYHRAILIGTPSFGKGSVQTVLPLNKDSAIKLTTALYYTPSGTRIQAKGIQPDVLLPDEIHIKKPIHPQDIINSMTFDHIKEINLHGHLSSDSKQNQIKQDKEKDTALLYTDFPIFVACTILQSLQTTR